MALSERSRSELYRGLISVVDEDAVGEMLSFFPARDVEVPVTKEYLRSEMVILRSEVQAEIAVLRSEVQAELAELRGDLTSEIAGLRGELKDDIAESERRVVASIRGEIRRSVIMNAAMIVTFAGVLVGALRV